MILVPETVKKIYTHIKDTLHSSSLPYLPCFYFPLTCHQVLYDSQYTQRKRREGGERERWSGIEEEREREKYTVIPADVLAPDTIPWQLANKLS